MGLLILVPLGCQQTSDPGPLETAVDLQKSGQTDQAIDLLADGDIEQCLRESSLESLKMSEAQFAELSRSGRSEGQEEMLLVVPLVKQAAFQQIETMKATEADGRTAESKQLREQIQRLIRDLQGENRVSLYQQLGSGIKRKLDQATSKQKTDETDSKVTD
ncbi:hypothetical protein [Gimesia sp.]|uniref:hypothetical protein n=1 Tax=Gimesia sp. TaxID=2024833 RepID=UPI003A92B6B6